MFDPENRTFPGDLNKIINKLKNKEKFSIVRYGDGEAMIFRKKGLDNRLKYESGSKFDPKDAGDVKLRQMLVKSFTFNKPGYYVGIPCPCCVGNKKFEWMKKVSKQPEERLTWANIFVNSNYNTFVEEVIPIFKEYEDITIVCNENATLENLPFSIAKDYRVGMNAWKKNKSIIGKIIDEIPENSLLLTAAGFLAKIIVHKVSEAREDVTSLDIGSTLNPFLFGNKGLTRGYLRGESTIRKVCRWQ